MSTPNHAPQPERSPQPTPQPFVLELMSDDQIILLSRVITEACDGSTTGKTPVDAEGLLQLEALEQNLEHALNDFALDHSDRADSLFTRLITSNNAAELDAACYLAKGLAGNNADLAVDGLLTIRYGKSHGDFTSAELAAMVLFDIEQALPDDRRQWFEAKLAPFRDGR